MAKADVIALATALANSQDDTTMTSDYYDRMVQKLARFPWLTQASLIATTAGTSQYTLTSTQGKLLAVFYDDRLLDRISLRAIEAVNPEWRDERGDVEAYIVEDEAAKTFRLYRNPTVTSKNFIFLFGAPLSMDFPTYACAIIHTEIRETLPVWLELPVAWAILGMEYGRESNHQDMQMAEACEQMSALLLSMVG